MYMYTYVCIYIYIGATTPSSTGCPPTIIRIRYSSRDSQTEPLSLYDAAPAALGGRWAGA